MNAKLGFVGSLEARTKTAPGPGLAWKARNYKNVLPGIAKGQVATALGMNHMLGALDAKHIKPYAVVDYGRISTKLVTTQFCEFMVDQLIAEGATWGDFKFHDSGVGVTGANIADTGIETTDGESRATGTQVEGTSVQYSSVGTIAYTTTKAITEHGIFNDATTGTLMDRHTFSAINVVNGDSIEFTYTLTCTAGG